MRWHRDRHVSQPAWCPEGANVGQRAAHPLLQHPYPCELPPGTSPQLQHESVPARGLHAPAAAALPTLVAPLATCLHHIGLDQLTCVSGTNSSAHMRRLYPMPSFARSTSVSAHMHT